MRLLGWCMAAALVAGVAAVPQMAKAQALGEAATLSSGVSAAGSGAGAALGRRIGGAMRSEGRRVASKGGGSTSGGVMNLHWSRAERERYARTERTRGPRAKATAKGKNAKPQPEFQIIGADSPNADSDDAAASQAKPEATANKDGAGGK